MTYPRRQAARTLAVTVIAIVVLIASTFTTECCDAYTLLPSTSFQTKRSVMYMKRGRGSFQKEVGGGSSSSSTGSSAGGIGSSSGSSFGAGGSNRNWLQVPDKTTDDLPTVEGKVQLLETQAYLLKNAQTNPNGAVSVLKYEGETYCFEANCPNCKIPMTKAKPLPPNEETKQTKAPRVACDFCQSTYNLKTGEKLQSQEGGGLLGGITKALLGAKESGPLKIYQLGEKNKKIMFSMD